MAFEPTKGPAREAVDAAELAAAGASIVLDARRRRPRYFDGRFLAARDLTRDQDYVLTRQADFGRILGPGVAHGLEVRLDAAEPGRRLVVTAGHGLTPAGEVVLVRQDTPVDLLDIAQAQRLDAVFGLEKRPRPPARTRTGLFVLCLRPVEYTANPVAAYPTSLTGDRGLQDGEIIEAVAFTLVPWPLEGSAAELDRRRSDAAREIFLLGTQRGLPAEALPLAMVALERGLIRWVDPWLVRRELGVGATLGFGRRALREAFLRQFDAHLQAVADRVGGEAGFAAADHFSVLPPFGRVPSGAVTGAGSTLSQIFFPGEANVTLTVVPEDELAALAEDALALPAIDLSLPAESLESLEIAVLVPVPRSDFAATVRRLAAARAPGDERDPRLVRLATRAALPVSRIKPLDALYKLKGLRLPPPVLAPELVELDPWFALLRAAANLWYVRRRHMSHASDAVWRMQPVEAEPDPDPEPDVIVIPDRVRERLEAAGEFGRYQPYIRRLDRPRAEALFALVDSEPLSQPMMVSGLITNLDPRRLPDDRIPPVERPAEAQPIDEAAVLARYRAAGRPTGIASLVRLQRGLDELEIRRTIAQSLLVPEIDGVAEELGARELRAAAALLLDAAREGRVDDIRRFALGARRRGNPLVDVFIRERLARVDENNPLSIREVARSFTDNTGVGLERATAASPTLVAGDVPTRLAKLDLLARLDAVAARLPTTTLGNNALKKTADALAEAAAAGNDVRAGELLANLEARFP